MSQMNMNGLMGLNNDYMGLAGMIAKNNLGKNVGFGYDSLKDTLKTLNGQSGGTKWTEGLGAISQGVSALTGLANAYLGYQNYKLGKEQFAFEKGLANRNVANQAKVINTTYNNAGQVSAGLEGAFGNVNPDTVKRYEKQAKDQHVDGSPIG